MEATTKFQPQVIPYKDEIKEMFKVINYEWIEKYFELTDLDRKSLNNPQAEILDKGGYIYFAEYDNVIVGSVALERITDKVYALTKMGVRPGYQGKRIGNLLIEKAIEQAQKLDLDSLVLYTNHVLIQALNLYYKHGFRIVPLDYTPYKRATIKMQLILK